ncbi:aminoglycoside phosphotransferase family protein [Aliiroseovarius sp.]|uniref:phosphotransferase family protein n=1 Tax=Aliiroseovarius sp. TaxID=1872442 RepID=UPI0026034E6E|nr:aminoglycoside phosphotransferase family protein [Aliiroseovarius sp.]
MTEVEPLTGGVASDIAMVAKKNRRFCVKFALPKLKVAADWHAPVHRNAAEYAWLKVAADLLPESAVQLFGRSEEQHGFAMEFLDGDDVYLWKASLLAEAPDQGEAARVADMIGRIHAASSKPGFDAAPFQNRDDFRALRIEPYLTYTAGNHPDLAEPIGALEAMLYDSQQVLVHGDVSPKNILFRTGGPVLLDAECATMGDASFDPSFCLNHLVLKAVHLPGSRGRLLADVGRFWNAYAQHIGWEPAQDLEARICRLLPALMLGRVDGKSPVEYLDETERAQVRRIAISLICEPTDRLDAFVKRVASELKEESA